MVEAIGEYKIIKRIDGGGNGDVFFAEDSFGKEVAIKILREDNRNNKSAKKRNRKKQLRFKIETEMVLKLQKEIEGIIPILSYGLPDAKTKKFWYAMPLAVPLKDKLKDLGSLEEKVNCILEVAETLILLHEKDIVHRDIKPQNIYFYNGKYCLGDFGLVDYPAKKDLTLLQEPVGPKATMAPEMRYNAKEADGKKADVYSLAKTLWIVLTGMEYGFEGRYDEDDAIIGLRNDKRYKKEHLVELEEILKQATEYDPMLRPTIKTFASTLETWIEIKSDIHKRNHSEWRYLQNKLFPKSVPLHVEWKDIDSIIRILNNIGAMPGLNHMFLPTGGGQDIETAKTANEEGCICLIAGGCNYIFKPNKLELENFGKRDYRWSYFRLELKPIEAVSKDVYMNCDESVIEDLPGHYTVSNLANYGRYSDGSKFPKGYQQVNRLLKGTLVIFSKQSIYNYISGTYDARHNKLSSTEFRRYIATMQQTYYTMNDFEDFLKFYQKNPGNIKNETDREKIEQEIEESYKFDKFVKENWDKWCLKSICDKNNYKSEGKMEYVIMFYIGGGVFFERRYIGETGYIFKEDFPLLSEGKEGKYVFSDFNGAVSAIVEIKEYIKKLCNESGIIWKETGLYFTIDLFRIGPPSHLFTKEEIKEALRTGNDFRNNQLVIDDDGYAQLIDSDLPYESYRYPVTQESYDARNNYVGPYANLDDVDEIYVNLLDGWLHHLQTGQQYSIDYYDQTMQEEEILKAITDFINSKWGEKLPTV